MTAMVPAAFMTLLRGTAGISSPRKSANREIANVYSIVYVPQVRLLANRKTAHMVATFIDGVMDSERKQRRHGGTS